MIEVVCLDLPSTLIQDAYAMHSHVFIVRNMAFVRGEPDYIFN